MTERSIVLGNAGETTLTRRILVTSRSFSKATQAPRRLLEAEGFALDWQPGPLGDAELAAKVKGYCALIVGTDKASKETFRSADALEVVAVHGAGFDNVDLTQATEHGIVVTNAPGLNAVAVAEYTIALMLLLARNIIPASLAGQRGEWSGERFMGTELAGKTLGIVGLGHIGREVARRAVALGMDVVYWDRVIYADFTAEHGITCLELAELLKRSDFVSLHISLSEETRHLLGAHEFQQMKRTSYLINTARGEVVDELALCEALKRGSIAGAGLDVFSKEPPGSDHPLLRLATVVSLPHIGAYTVEANERTGLEVARDVVRVLKGEAPRWGLNYEEARARRRQSRCH